MISEKQAMEIAKIKSLKPWQEEKHYVMSVALMGLSEEPLVFKGGTYLWFFHGLPRFSEDLDFTATAKTTSPVEEKVSKTLKLFGIENKGLFGKAH